MRLRCSLLLTIWRYQIKNICAQTLESLKTFLLCWCRFNKLFCLNLKEKSEKTLILHFSIINQTWLLDSSYLRVYKTTGISSERKTQYTILCHFVCFFDDQTTFASVRPEGVTLIRLIQEISQCRTTVFFFVFGGVEGCLFTEF